MPLSRPGSLMYLLGTTALLLLSLPGSAAASPSLPPQAEHRCWTAGLPSTGAWLMDTLADLFTPPAPPAPGDPDEDEPDPHP